jgi:hypothetical protein
MDGCSAYSDQFLAFLMEDVEDDDFNPYEDDMGER